MLQEIQSDDVIGDNGVGGARVLQTQLSAILAELRVLTCKVREDSRDKKLSGEWKLLAMVVDRLCFCVFSALFVIATVVVFRRQLY